MSKGVSTTQICQMCQEAFVYARKYRPRVFCDGCRPKAYRMHSTYDPRFAKIKYDADRDARDLKKYGHRGVHRTHGGGHSTRAYYAEIIVNGVAVTSPGHGSAEEAARAYDVMARLYHGDRAVLNFPPKRQRNPYINRLEAMP